MHHLKTAPFGVLFAVSYVVSAIFQCVVALLSVVAVLILLVASGISAPNASQVLLVIPIALVGFLLITAVCSAVGAGIWLGLRKLVFRTPRAATAA